MADILPFPAIRPTAVKAPYVVSHSYETYSESERATEMEKNPFSFLHVLNPGFKASRRLKGLERFKGVRNGYLKFMREGILIREDKPSYYLYKSRSPHHSSYGIFCATSVRDYRNGVIRRHEETLKKREELFADYLEAVQFNAEPVLIAYPHNPEIQGMLEGLMTHPPEYRFTTSDTVLHQMWIVSEPEAVAMLRQAFDRIPTLYIADGHHRTASSEVLASRLGAKGTGTSRSPGYEYFMSYLLDESQLKIGSYSRLITDLNGQRPEEILKALGRHYAVEKRQELSYEPNEKHSFGMYLDGSYYALHLKGSALELTDPMGKLDCHILHKTILGPILGIEDLRTDSRIVCRHSPFPGEDVRQEVESGRYALGFTMRAVTLEEIRKVADAGGIMPPKTSYMEPKLRSGLTIYDINYTDEHS